MDFKELQNYDISKFIEVKEKLNYLSWANAWSLFKQLFPDANYKIKPYHSDEFGIMVYTEVSVNGQTLEMFLPVMNDSNKAMKKEPYTYQVKEYKNYQFTGKYIDKTVQAASMFDINKAYMRCLVKNIAMFGLGLKLYSGEDLPDISEIDNEFEEPKLTQEEIDKQHYLNQANLFKTFLIDNGLNIKVDFYKKNPSLISSVDKITKEWEEIKKGLAEVDSLSQNIDDSKISFESSQQELGDFTG